VEEAKDGSTTLPRNKYTEIRAEKPNTKDEAKRPEFKVCKFTTEAIVTDGSEVGALRKVCANPACPIHHPEKRQNNRDDGRWKAEQEKQRREQAIANTTALDANDWFNDHYNAAQPALRQNDFGGTVGGPIWIPRIYDGRKRTFFFVSYEGLRLTQPTAAAIQYVPDLFMRRQAVSAMQPIFNAFPLPNGLDYGNASACRLCARPMAH
jgi:hypothetical protein